MSHGCLLKALDDALTSKEGNHCHFEHHRKGSDVTSSTFARTRSSRSGPFRARAKGSMAIRVPIRSGLTGGVAKVTVGTTNK
jgi:hypothetical protein